jgi:hypothetical protein
MSPASAAFIAPETIRRLFAGEVILKITPPTTTPADLEQQLRQKFGVPAVGAHGAIRVAERMTANLTRAPACSVVAHDAADRAIPVGETAEWH